MADYRAAKEAFVADNVGSSIWSINAVSLFGLTAYALYATTRATRPPHPAWEYLITVLPLLLGVTVASTRPFLFNLLFGIPAVISLNHARLQRSSTAAGFRHAEKKSMGQWLNESDSDEEPAEPASPSGSKPSPRIKLPSTVVAEANSSAVSPSPSPLPANPLTGADESPSGPSQRTWKRRHSPSPSTHTHTAINILLTPDNQPTSSLSADKSSYPSLKPARYMGTTSTKPTPKDRMPFLSVYRAHMMIMTIHCILAVDFPVFPRWQGKCEDFGTSLMDVGVGSFIFSLGIVSTRSFASSKPESRWAMLRSTWRSVRKSGPVLLLGMIRLLMVKGTEYPEHITEYGVHWNFFFTLGLLPIFGNLLWPIRQRYLHWSVMGVFVTLVHQTILSSTPLQSWALSSARIGLIGMNKEGIVSLPGYTAIYLLGLATGQHILRSASSPAAPTPNDSWNLVVPRDKEQLAGDRVQKRRTELALELFGYSVAWWSALGLCRLVGMGVSRRLAVPGFADISRIPDNFQADQQANLPYVLWTAAFNSSFLLGYLLIESHFLLSPTSTSPCPALLEAINANGLAVFLIANLLTGLVNLSIQTMYASKGISVLVLLLYSGGVCSLAWALRKRRLKL